MTRKDLAWGAVTRIKPWMWQTACWVVLAAVITWVGSDGDTFATYVKAGFVLCALIAILLFIVVYAGEKRADRHRGMSIVAHAALRRHIVRTDYRLQALLDYLEVEVTEPVADDSPGHEIELMDDEPVTEPIPVQRPTPGPRPEPNLPATQPQEAVLVGKWAEEIDTDAITEEVDTRIHDVEMAQILAGFEDRIWRWQHDKEAAA